jgi:hypothetical protein
MKFPWITLTIFAMACSGAYWEHVNYDPQEESAKNRQVTENLNRSPAAEAMEEQRKCLEENPMDWCNRDMSYADHLRSAKSTSERYNYGDIDDTKTRNLYIFIALISGFFLYSSVKELVKERSKT